MRGRDVGLLDLVTVTGGGTPDRKTPEYWEGAIPWATVKDLTGRDLITTKDMITPSGLAASAANLIPAGAVLLATRIAVGRAAINAVDVAINQDLKALRCGPDLDTRYLLHFLDSHSERLSASAEGATVKGITLDQLRRIRVPLPPLAEQCRIAALLDRADAVQRKQEQSRRLVDELLRSVFLGMFGDPVRNERGWEVVRLGEVTERIQIGPFGSLLHDSDYIDCGVPLINPTHIRDGRVVVDRHRTVAQQKAEALNSYRVLSGEVILGRRGEMGRCAIIAPDQSGYLCGTGSIVIRPDDDLLLPEYLQMILSSASIRGYLEKATQGATMPNLNRAIVADLPIILPPIAEQRRFASQRARSLSCRELYEVVLQELGSLSATLSASLLFTE